MTRGVTLHGELVPQLLGKQAIPARIGYRKDAAESPTGSGNMGCPPDMPGLEKKTVTHSVSSSRPRLFQTFSHQGRLFGTDAVFFSAGHARSLTTPLRCLEFVQAERRHASRTTNDRSGRDHERGPAKRKLDQGSKLEQTVVRPSRPDLAVWEHFHRICNDQFDVPGAGPLFFMGGHNRPSAPGPFTLSASSP